MDFKFRKAETNETNIAFDLLKLAAQTLAEKNINQWSYWVNPPKDKIEWIKDGFFNHEFFFIENDNKEIMGMFRLLDDDPIYWGEMNDKAKYLHSLIIHNKFSNNKIGKRVIDRVSEEALKNGIHYLRLDCEATNRKLCEYYENQGFIKVNQKTLPYSTYNLYQKRLS